MGETLIITAPRQVVIGMVPCIVYFYDLLTGAVVISEAEHGMFSDLNNHRTTSIYLCRVVLKRGAICILIVPIDILVEILQNNISA